MQTILIDLNCVLPFCDFTAVIQIERANIPECNPDRGKVKLATRIISFIIILLVVFIKNDKNLGPGSSI